MEAVVDQGIRRFILDNMQLGLISDIHGDMKALERAITLLKIQHRVDLIWCAGDLVGRGNQPDEVVSEMIQRRIPTVMGNHDEMVLLPQQIDNQRRMLLGQLLGYRPQTLSFLTTLPRTYRAHFSGRVVVMVHGTPRSNAEGVSLNPAQNTQSMAWLERIGADILITGHTHVPMMLRNERGLLVNPGSLFNPTGFQRSSSETYGVLDVVGMRFRYYPLWD
jgi:putative phosphoesterase